MTTEDKKISSIYHEADSAQPPTHLDDAILAASRDAIARKSQTRSPFSGGWPVPAAMAAVVVVAVIIVPVVTQESKQDKPVPVKTTADEPAATTGKLEQQRLNAPETRQTSPSRLMQSAPSLARPMAMEDLSMEEKVAPEAPAASTPALLMHETDALSSGVSAGRINKQDAKEKARAEKKSVASQGLLKSERAKRVRSPQGWVNYIKQLIADNKLERARIELKNLKAFYPDYTIDPELIERLKQ